MLSAVTLKLIYKSSPEKYEQTISIPNKKFNSTMERAINGS